MDWRGSEEAPPYKTIMPSSGFGPWLLGKQGVASAGHCLGLRFTRTACASRDQRHHAVMDNTIIMLNVEGTPRPQPRPRLCRGRVVSTADANARRWQDMVRGAAKVALDAHGALEGPLEVCFSFQFGTPKSERHGKPHTFRPDADNLAKLALDAVMKSGLFKDDSQVSMMVVRKTWAKDGSMVMTLTEDKREETTAQDEVMTHPRWMN